MTTDTTAHKAAAQAATFGTSVSALILGVVAVTTDIDLPLAIVLFLAMCWAVFYAAHRWS